MSKAKLPENWKPCEQFQPTYSATNVNTFNFFKRSGIPLVAEGITFEDYDSESQMDIFLNKLYCGLIIKTK